MKPMGPIPQEFQAKPLIIRGRPLDYWTAQTPVFVYDMTVVESRIARFRAAFPGVDLHYAVKANPFAALLARMAPLVNLGGGFGIPYFPGEVPVDVEAIGAALQEKLTSLPPELAGAKFAIELGRWLVGEAGVYLTRVIDRKESRGEVFLVCDGGLNHQLAATGNLGTVVRRNYPIAVANAPAGAPVEVVSVVGPLCTPLDRLADQVELPVAKPGDVIAVFMAGAYGLSASPFEFLGHARPPQILAI